MESLPAFRGRKPEETRAEFNPTTGRRESSRRERKMRGMRKEIERLKQRQQLHGVKRNVASNEVENEAWVADASRAGDSGVCTKMGDRTDGSVVGW